LRQRRDGGEEDGRKREAAQELHDAGVLHIAPKARKQAVWDATDATMAPLRIGGQCGAIGALARVQRRHGRSGSECFGGMGCVAHALDGLSAIAHKGAMKQAKRTPAVNIGCGIIISS
jgi:hypothetical protein